MLLLLGRAVWMINMWICFCAARYASFIYYGEGEVESQGVGVGGEDPGGRVVEVVEVKS